MAAVPLTDPHVLALRCDRCGRYLAGLTAQADSWPLLWDLALEHGWVGGGRPDAAHQCPRCASRSPYALRLISEPSGRLQARLHALEKIVVCRLAGELDVTVIRELRALLTFLSDRHVHIVLDLRALRLLDSKVVGVLLRTRHGLLRRGGLLCLAAPSPLVVALLGALRLAGVFEVFDSGEDAVRRLQHADDESG